MTALNDLTFGQIASQLPPDSIKEDGAAPNTKTMIDVSLVVGKPITDLSQQGVVDFMVKLREACASAQVAANTNQPSGEKLNSFDSLRYGNLGADGTVQVQGNIVARMQVSPQALHLIGTNV